MLNFLLKTRQKRLCRIHARGQRHRNTYVYNYQRERLQGMLLTANEDNIMETQKQSAIDSPFSVCGKYIEWGNDMRRKKSMWGEVRAYMQDIPNRKDCSGCLLTKALMRQRRNECAEFDGQSTGASPLSWPTVAS